MGKLPIHVVEAFTIGANQPFTGNTAAVCILEYDDDISDELKQKIGMQMNYSETAFIAKGWTNSSANDFNSSSNTHWTLRWFTPAKEVELCGHATLAAASVIFNQILKKHGTTNAYTLVFETKYKGNMQATIDWSTGLIALNFPANSPAPLPSDLLGDSDSWVNKIITGVIGSKLQRSVIEDVRLPPNLGYLMIRLKGTGDPIKNAELLSSIQPDFHGLTAATAADCRIKLTGVVVTIQGLTAASAEKDKPRFYSRFFAPYAGIDEDPVTGSAHTILAPYWFDEFRKEGVNLDGQEILGQQLSARKGEILCSLAGNDRVKMVGQSRLGMSGEFYPD